jgi:hypothetical protein
MMYVIPQNWIRRRVNIGGACPGFILTSPLCEPLGRIADAETKFTPGGVGRTTFSIATSRRWKDKQTNELRVMRVEGGFSSWFAFCKRAGTPNFEPIPEAREVRIAFERFRPTSTGYALVE